MAPEARYQLSDVFRLLDEKKFWFSARSRSIFQVARIFEARGEPLAEDEVETFILRGIKALTDAHFVQRVIQWDDPKCVADVYGIIFEGCPWYLKFLVDEEGLLEQISFHSPEKDLVTTGGIMVPKGAFGL